MPTTKYGRESKVNPKDRFGLQKVSISKLPAVAIIHAAHAMMNGATKYGAYNWRDKHVLASIYVDAMLRHVFQWFEGELAAQDSACHHLGHAIACAAILLDAEARGCLIDDRPKSGPKVVPHILDAVSKAIQRQREQAQHCQHGFWDHDACPDCVEDAFRALGVHGS